MSSKTKPRFGVEAVRSDDVEVEAPYCPHGPTLVFQRYYADKEPRSFFACALHRDRKGCPFFHWVDDKISPEKRERWMQAYHETNPVLNRNALTESLKSLSSHPVSKRVFCNSCSELLLSSSVYPDHATHTLRYGVEDTLLVQPTRLLMPQDDKKSNAQYLFSELSCQLLISELKRLKVTGVVCVGTPRLHESILSQLSPSVSSLLLDVDRRYAQFYPQSQYQRYNMFNGHFYEDEGERVCREFLNSGAVAIVIDPPFGGLVGVLARQVRCLWNMAGKELITVLVFPYFMEEHVSTALPTLKMCDYQVTYDNHKHFTKSRKSTKPSPVRLFTNLPLPGPRLPHSQGYTLCHLCQRYVAPNNAHCSFCDLCTSKDGRKYRHCHECGVCVKPAREHCAVCRTCQLPHHQCCDKDDGSVAVGCHICGCGDHKRRDCPQKAQRTGGVSQERQRKGTKRRKLPSSETSSAKRKHTPSTS